MGEPLSDRLADNSDGGYFNRIREEKGQMVQGRRKIPLVKAYPNNGYSLIRQRDARCHPRYSVHKIVTYKYRGKQFLTLTLDLGMGGMKIKSRRHLQGNKVLQFKLILGADSIWLKGRTVYSGFLPDKQHVSGIQFTGLFPGDYGLLQRYLETLEAWLSLREGGSVRIRSLRGCPGIDGEITEERRLEVSE